jgi:Acyl-CoA dehydrogenase N terminal
MGHYKSNLRDTEFTLFEVLGVGERLGAGPFGEVDEETARGILTEVERLASGPIAESLVDSDRNPPVFDPATSSVTLPESFKKSYAAYLDAEW